MKSTLIVIIAREENYFSRFFLKARIEEIAENPSGGKCLQRELSGYLCLRVNWNRVIYRISEKERVVEIHLVGRRRDVYELFGEHLGISVLDGG